MDVQTLYREIANVCPIVSASMGEADNRSTWSFVAEDSATQPQIDAGNNVIATIPMETVPPQASIAFIQRFTDAEYLALKQKHEADLAASDVSDIKLWDSIMATNTLNLNSAPAQDLKASLVADGILTQQRADEIFSSSAPVGLQSRIAT